MVRIQDATYLDTERHIFAGNIPAVQPTWADTRCHAPYLDPPALIRIATPVASERGVASCITGAPTAKTLKMPAPARFRRGILYQVQQTGRPLQEPTQLRARPSTRDGDTKCHGQGSGDNPATAALTIKVAGRRATVWPEWSTLAACRSGVAGRWVRRGRWDGR